MICKFCQRDIVHEESLIGSTPIKMWVCPEAGTDMDGDGIWRETCPDNHLDPAGHHEPQYQLVRVVTTLALAPDVEITPAMKDAFINLAYVMDVQAEDGLYAYGFRHADPLPGEPPNDFLVDFEDREVEVQYSPEISHRGRGVTVQLWPAETDEAIVVQIDTVEQMTGRLRVNVNEARVFNKNPDDF